MEIPEGLFSRLKDEGRTNTSNNADSGTESHDRQDMNPKVSLKEYIYKEIRPTTGKRSDDDKNELEDIEIEYDLEQIMNILKVPAEIEQLMTFSLLACLNCFLHFFTILPLRIIHGLSLHRSGLRKIRKELITGALIVGSCLILITIDTSRIYHKIKGQNAIKLYMIFQVLEMAEKLLSSIGLDLFSTVLSSNTIKYKHKLIGLYIACCLCQTLHSLIFIYQILAMNVAVNSYSNSLWTLLLSMQFAEIKASVFKRIDKEGLFQLAIADIVERFQLIIFLIVIAVRNFVAAGNTWIDVLPHSWNLHSTHSLLVGVFFGPIITVIGSELIVDWVKHAYIIKFNRIRPHVYERYLQIICSDHLLNINRFQRRLGLSVPTLVIAFSVLISPSLKQIVMSNKFWSILILLLGFIWLVLIKVLLQIVLLKWSRYLQNNPPNAHQESLYVNGMLSSGRGKMDEDVRRMIHTSYNSAPVLSTSNPARAITPPGSPKPQHTDKKPFLPPSLNELRTRRDQKHPRSLENVERYKMVSKRIW